MNFPEQKESKKLHRLHRLVPNMKIIKVIIPLIASFLLAEIIYPYFSWKLDIDFLQTKQRIIHLRYYQLAFYIHIFSSLPVLFFGAFLFSERIQKRFSKIHRWMGKGYVALVLILSAPSGMVLAMHANGGFLVQASFLLATPLWWYFTWKGLQTALKKNFTDHRRWMLRSYAVAFSAVTLRASQLVLNVTGWISPEFQYLFVAWESWILNLILVEFYLRKAGIKGKVFSVLKIFNREFQTVSRS